MILSLVLQDDTWDKLDANAAIKKISTYLGIPEVCIRRIFRFKIA